MEVSRIIIFMNHITYVLRTLIFVSLSFFLLITKNGFYNILAPGSKFIPNVQI